MQEFPFSVGEELSHVIQLLLRSLLLFLPVEKCFLESSKHDAELQSYLMWSPVREENFLPCQG